MSDATEPSFPSPQLGVLRIIVLAMTIGVLAFLAVGLVLNLAPERQPSAEKKQTSLTYIALVFGIGTIVAGPYLSRSIATSARRRIMRTNVEEHASRRAEEETGAAQGQDTTSKLVDVFRAKALIGAAMDEAAGLFACAAYLVEARTATAGLAGIIILSLLLNMPTRRRADLWLGEQLRLMDDEGRGELPGSSTE